MTTPKLLLAALGTGWAAIACVPGSAGLADAAPAQQPSPRPIAASVAAPEHGPEPEPEPALEGAALSPQPEPPPPPEVRDSAIVAQVSVDPQVQPGLQAFASELAPGGALWVGRLDGNGGRDVLVYIPPGFDDAAPFELIFHFHGTHSEHVEKRRDGLEKKRWVGWDRLAQTLEAATELQQARPYNVALVYPFSAGKRLEPDHKGWSNVAYDRMWMAPVAPPDYRDDFAKLDAEVRELLTTQLGVHPSKLPAEVVAEGHSAGGIALRNIAVHGPATGVRELLFLDASFQDWADGAYAAVEQRGAATRLTLVVTEEGIADPFAGRTPWCAELERDAGLWAAQANGCAGTPDQPVAGSDWTCAELEDRERQWREDYADWCVAMKDDMRSVPRVRVVKTKVTHGKQPREFVGGLRLP